MRERDPLEVSMADLDDAIDGLFEPPEPSPAVPLKHEPPAMVEGLASEVYHADPNSVGCGCLHLFRRSPYHYWYWNRRPGVAPNPPTDAQRFGSAVHTAILEPELFDARYAVRPAVIDRRTREGKAAYSAFLETSGGREELPHDDAESVRRIAAMVGDHPTLKTLLGVPGRKEASVYWTDKGTGVRCRCRPDFAPDNKPYLVDLKCTQDASDLAVGKAAANLNWPMRAAWYVDGWKALTGERRSYIFCVWESSEPYSFAAYSPDDDVVKAGREMYQVLLRRFAACLAADEWPSYPTEVQPLIMPSWWVSE